MESIPLHTVVAEAPAVAAVQGGGMGMSEAKAQELPIVELDKRYFTVPEANRALVLVRRIVGDVLGDYQQVLDLQEVLEAHQEADRVENARQAQEDIIALVKRLQGCSDELIEIGAEMKDWSAGVVDFPTLAGGQEVQLCWRHGEETILFWHRSDDGCGCRQEIRTLPAEQ